MIFLFLVTCVLLTNYTNASNSSYGELPQPEYEEIPGEFPLGALSSLFNMARGFVNIVFVSFTNFKDLFFEILDNALQSKIPSDWQNILVFQKGLVACLVFGILFVILVIFGGMMTCLCRCCCSKCGGRYGQSRERAYSQMRVWLTYLMIFFIILTFLPCLFIYVTSGWITDTLKTVPLQTNPRLENLALYVENLPKQLEFETDQFGKLTKKILDEIDGVNSTSGMQLKDDILKIAQPTLDNLKDVELVINETSEIASNASGTLVNLTTKMNDLNDGITNLKSTINKDLDDESACDGSIETICKEIKEKMLEDLNLVYDESKVRK